MPRDLPGFYWDEEKKRYFPESSRPAGSTPKPALPDAAPQQQSRRRRRSPRRTSSESPPPKRPHAGEVTQSSNAWRSLGALRGSTSSVHRRRCVHELEMECLAQGVSKVENIPISFDGPITALCTKVTGNHNKQLLVGDMTGWLYSLDPEDPVAAMREFGLRSQITSITRSGSVCMVTSLGSPARLLATRDDAIGLWVLREIPPALCSDVWCGQVWGRRATVGGRKGLICFPDVERDSYLRLHSTSDVLSLCLQDENITYMGMRNGMISRWDSRQASGKTDTIVNMSEAGDEIGPGVGRGAASVDHLRIVHGYELLVRTMRGDLETHDLRFLRNQTPFMQLKGHVPSYESILGIAVDPGEKFVFAGGGDSHLRIWSLRTGQLLPTNETNLAVTLDGTIARPAQPIRAMEIVEDDSKVQLWMACSNTLSKVDLGPRGLFL
ncbi:hypothetical protein L226DRAFT_326476 [Lentinus tigrinus ALCF2SS1-7]|uniref:Uncharacterized protein n=1 Tax=Lentinus tigrinus ALCF2SS1-6 TaxID=1328759 RepID=A0A5C2SFV1_9APHY|nr:hypothetical protein L227DRAFT_432362 [Lentinus tigrinus ALCF2SS1-6]RPD77588.1 hypothetical protein L226DRAFT_326476 [Lentinus tigrinus ALCF2SS1-7]